MGNRGKLRTDQQNVRDDAIRIFRYAVFFFFFLNCRCDIFKRAARRNARRIQSGNREHRHTAESSRTRCGLRGFRIGGCFGCTTLFVRIGGAALCAVLLLAACGTVVSIRLTSHDSRLDVLQYETPLESDRERESAPCLCAMQAVNTEHSIMPCAVWEREAPCAQTRVAKRCAEM